MALLSVTLNVLLLFKTFITPTAHETLHKFTNSSSRGPSAVAEFLFQVMLLTNTEKQPKGGKSPTVTKLRHSYPWPQGKVKVSRKVCTLPSPSSYYCSTAAWHCSMLFFSNYTAQYSYTMFHL